MENLIELKNVSKTFEKSFFSTGKTILKNINFTVKPGDFVVLRGDNGSGKTTILNLILGLIKPTSGQVELMGIESKNPESKNRVGVVLQETQFPKHLSVLELLDLFRGYYSNPISTKEALDRVSLTDKQNSKAISLSGGQKQRLLFALALIGNPQLLILDEPTRNLDEDGYKEFWQQIYRCKEQSITILMVTNNQSDWEQLNSLATRYITLKKFSEDLEGSQIEIEESNVPVSPVSNLNLDADQPTSSNNAFFAQLWSEILQIYRTPLYLLGIVVPILAIIVSIALKKEGDEAKNILLGLSFVYMIAFALQALPGQISTERAEGWLKLLRSTPLSSEIYIAAKIVVSLLISVGVVLLTLIVGSLTLGFSFDPLHWIALFVAFIIVAIPLLGFSLTVGYLVNPKSVNNVNGLAFFVILLLSRTIEIPNLFLEKATVLSPVYHAQKLIFLSADFPIDGKTYLLLHLSWLLWASGIFITLAVWAYQRDSVTE
ncbi:ABC transporter [Planktothricoides sp. SR001]|uniref:ABC transporter ATP-binding protein/permease n=1 Tax=Planktothricoides sp. SR001 TaxID=1705388 RepID=UPI0006BF6085|nr:ABC transporter ATP-binding protein/permease [Planktothricoides sp. SR001]KOR37067.1 ABC transporter [Planktothricoides sp. SR001]